MGQSWRQKARAAERQASEIENANCRGGVQIIGVFFMMLRLRKPLMFLAHFCFGAGAFAIGGSQCSTDLDCQLNGLCTGGICVCDAAWKGGNCSSLNLQPAARSSGFGHLASNRSSWGGGVIEDPNTGKWIMFLSQMNMACGLATWGTNSRCVLAESDTPAGPYTQTRVVVDSWCHGATPGYDPVSKTWLFNHMGNGQEKSGGCYLCSNGTTTNHGKGKCSKGGPGTIDTGSALTSQSPYGPYTVQSKMINGANCESFFSRNGTLYMACPSGGHTTAPNCNGNNAFLHMSRAANIDDAIAGKYEKMPVRTRLAGTNDPYEDEPSFCFNWEDQNVWIDKRGNFHTLMHAFRGQPCDYPVCDRVHNHTFCSAVGGHAFSRNGYDWNVSPVIAYTPTVQWDDGTQTTFRARERPHLILDQEGTPTHLITGVGDPCPGGGGGNTGCPGHGGDHTFTLVAPLHVAGDV